ncbi:hypothetical protein [Streptomyces sp. NPDC026589]|uniref:hypothetical protein n=1 Tax=Streptomyces sp. NPDC026589 TaxID=3155609 RepID=UPI0033F49F11
MMLKSKLARAAAVGAAAATMLFTSTYPAIAQQTDEVGVLSNITLEIAVGTMTFIDDGDVFKICDTAKNGQGVYGALFYNSYINSNGWDRVMKTVDGGDKGCDKKPHNVGNGGQYVMALCDGRYPTSILHNGDCMVTGTFNE